MFKLKAGDGIMLVCLMGMILMGLTACGGGGLGGGASATVSNALGKVLAGPVAGAKVIVDMNDNRQIDPTDFTCARPTESDGAFNCASRDSKGISTLGHAYITQGGMDMYTGLPVINTLLAPPNATVVTPLTTLVVAQIPPGVITPAAVNAANQAVTAALGLPNISLATTDSTAGNAISNQVAAVEAAIQQLMTQTIVATQILAGSSVTNTAATSVLQSITAAIALQNGVVIAPNNLSTLVSSAVNHAATQTTGSATTGNNLAQLFAQAVTDSLQTTLATSGAPALTTLQNAAADSAIAQASLQTLVAAMRQVVTAPTALTAQSAAATAAAISQAISNVVSSGQTLSSQTNVIFNAGSGIGVSQTALNSATVINGVVLGDVIMANGTQTANRLTVSAPLSTLTLNMSVSGILPTALPTAQSLGISISGVGNGRSLQAVINGLDFSVANGTQVMVNQTNSLLYVKAMTTTGAAANAILWTPANIVTSNNTGITVDIGAIMRALTQTGAVFNNASLARGNYVVTFVVGINTVPVVTPTGLPIRVVNVSVPNFLGTAPTKAILAGATGVGKSAIPLTVQ